MTTAISRTPDFVKPVSGTLAAHALKTVATNPGGAIDFKLPATGNERSPAFLDAAECANWLLRVPLANVSLAQPILLRQLNLLHRHDMPPGERFTILEALRRPVIDVQADAAKIFAGRPLPLATPEQAALERTLEVWDMLAQGYLRCFAALCEANGDRPPTLSAMLAQRTLSVFADWQVDLCRGEELPLSLIHI